jgi:hypothetical protein
MCRTDTIRHFCQIKALYNIWHVDSSLQKCESSKFIFGLPIGKYIRSPASEKVQCSADYNEVNT